jgi:hypothetical protein
MFSTQDIIEKIWNAQGYGNLAVWQDGTTGIIEPGASPSRDGNPPLAIFKPIVLVTKYPLLDHALSDPDLKETIEHTIREAGGVISEP